MPTRRHLRCLNLLAAFLGMSLLLASSARAAPKFKILHTVPGGMYHGLTLDAKGDLYGVTGAGGDHNDGTIFELTPGASGWTLTTLHSFIGYDGDVPNGGLIFDAAGNMYGTTPSGGGPNDGGVAFEMAPGSGGWTYSVFYRFCLQYHCPDGGGPRSGMIFDQQGSLYGTTVAGGTSGAGTVFELARAAASDNWDETVLYSFGSKPYDAENPYGAPVFDQAGDLYGTTYYGGVDRLGTVLKLKHGASEWKERLLKQFHGTDGAFASSGLVFDSSGSLYGTTVGGGSSGYGVVFKMAPGPKGGWKETLLHEFPKPENGSFPSSGLVFDKSGNLYGTTSNGGNPACTGGCGVVYKLTPGANGKWKYNVLHKFSGGDGGFPGGGLVIDQKGNLYGTAYSVVFEVTP